MQIATKIALPGVPTDILTSILVPASERAALTERDQYYDYQSRIGKVTAVNDKDPTSGGFYCELCEVLLRDSLSFTSHLNGRKHLRKAGVSEYTKRSTLEEVLAVLEFGRRKRFPERYIGEHLKRASRQAAMRSESGTTATTAMVKDPNAVPEKGGGRAEEEEGVLDAEDAEMQAMLGFSSFGGGASDKAKKK